MSTTATRATSRKVVAAASDASNLANVAPVFLRYDATSDGDGSSDAGVVGSAATAAPAASAQAPLAQTSDAPIVQEGSGSTPPIVTIVTSALPASYTIGSAGTGGIKLTGTEAGALTGSKVAATGDVNGDGIKDFLVAAPFADQGGSNTGSVYLVYGKVGLTALSLSASFTAALGARYVGSVVDGYLGTNVGGVGDINKDGYADFAIVTSGTTSFNTVYILLGKSGTSLAGQTLSSGISSSIGFTITSPTADGLGPVSGIGDINGDGFTDYIVGGPGNGSNLGAAWVLFGHAAAAGVHNINLGSLSASDGYKITGVTTNGELGFSVAAAGDVNKDGFADFIVGAPGFSGAPGAAYVLYGSAAPGSVNLAALTQSQGFKITGAGNDDAGLSVSSAGDINGDGFADVLVGTSGRGYNGLPGKVYVVYGHATGATVAVSVATMTAAQGFTINGFTSANFASGIGDAVAGIGDFNGDGFSDILINMDYGNVGHGGGYIIFGKANIAPTGALNLASFSASDGIKINGNPATGYSASAIAGIGDVNGDGGLDILVSDSGDNSSTGAAYVIFGQAVTNVAPTATNLSAAETYTEDTTLDLTNIVVSDPDSASVTATLTLSATAAGALTTAGGGSYNAGTGVWSVSGTVAVVNAALAAVTFVPTANYNLGFTIATSVSDGVAAAITGSKVLTAVPVDDLPVAVADTASVAENATVTITVLTNDTDVDTGVGATGGGAGTKAVATVNGATLSAGQTTTLASGAIVTLNANGTLGYNPNGKFDYLPSAAVAAATGASSSATDTFGYTLNGGSATTVTVTVTGVASSGTTDHLPGTGGNDIITGPNSPTYFDLSQGGNDTATGGSGNDGFYLGAAFTGADRIDGGGGTNDQIGLQGNYTGVNALVLQAATITNIEVIAALAGFDYNITTVDANVGAGQTLTINGAQLGAGDDLTFNGSAETDGMFKVFGGFGADNITTGGGNDGIYFGSGRFDVTTDHVDGGGGTNDQLALDGTYTGLTIARANVVNVEMLVLLDGQAARADYSITLADDWTTGAEVHTVFAVGVRNGVAVDGHLETTSMLRFYGGAGNDTLIGGSAGNWFDGGAGADTMTGGAGVDTFSYTTAANSMGVNYDRIGNFNPAQDKIDLPGANPVTGIDAAKMGTLSTGSFDADLTTALATLGANHAVQFTATGGSLDTHVFEVIDINGVAGYQAGQDMVVELVNLTGGAITATTTFI